MQTLCSHIVCRVYGPSLLQLYIELRSLTALRGSRKTVVLKLFRLGTPQIILFEVGTPLYLFDSIPQRNIVKTADLKAVRGVVSF